ncbi:16S rRNA m(2)G 1207 methyltransferase [Bacillus oleivorans]|uniref:16S rRNA m(2)G 1207 methyltransferase n=1 Tax=Bacillus oleivorans TaxID=1448271 RepID=A0A285D764_9BACI|nr:class I SAM-dependent methyltransferase [Bacillus oleivorans]SNX75654.1 16S rRNA m(2)G 1207 methyltransferase [Bacillus oleivorans]
MSDHYYSRKPEVKSNRSTVIFQRHNRSIRFTTDAGVFSKKEVDFGTRTLLESFEVPEVEGPYLDVGCGYGPIGISIAQDNPERLVHMVDINERAVQLAEENAEANQVKNVKIYQSEGFGSITENAFAAILTNPPIRAGKQVVHDILAKSYDHLVQNGELWVVIQKKQGAPSAKEKLEEIFGEAEVVKKNKGYFILKAIKR